MSLHDNEVPADAGVVRALLRSQCPEWAPLALSPAGAGTDNTMYRLGAELLVRLPRTADTARALVKEREWLPRLAPHLTCLVPEPLFAGRPSPEFPLPWSVYRWIDGAEVPTATIGDWATFGSDLAAFVAELHAVDLMGASRGGDLDWYRGGSLRDCVDDFAPYFDDRRRTDDELDIDTLERLWLEAVELSEPAGAHVWLHGDLRPANLLASGGRLHAVVDFGGLSVGLPAAEHAPAWDLPTEARHAYWNASNLDEATWAQARGWAIVVGVSGVVYYRDTWPAFAAECRARLVAILADASTR